MPKRKKRSRNIVKQHNDLISGRYSLTAEQTKFYLSIVAQIEKDDDDFLEYEVSIADFVEFTKKTNKDVYARARKITLALRETSLEIPLANGEFVQTGLFNDAHYFPKEGKVLVSISKHLKPYLLELKKNFTTYDLRNVLPLRSKYSILLFQRLKQFRRLGEKSFFIDELFEWLKVPDTYSYGNFKQRILLPVQKELKEHTEIYFTFDEIKTGRAVTTLKFHIYTQERSFKDQKSLTVTIANDGKSETHSPSSAKLDPLHQVLKAGIDASHDKAIYPAWFGDVDIVATETEIKLYSPMKFKADYIKTHYLDNLETIFTPLEVEVLLSTK